MQVRAFERYIPLTEICISLMFSKKYMVLIVTFSDYQSSILKKPHKITGKYDN